MYRAVVAIVVVLIGSARVSAAPDDTVAVPPVAERELTEARPHRTEPTEPIVESQAARDEDAPQPAPAGGKPNPHPWKSLIPGALK